jgi:hypothetical protein
MFFLATKKRSKPPAGFLLGGLQFTERQGDFAVSPEVFPGSVEVGHQTGITLE